MILSDKDIDAARKDGQINIWPWNYAQLQPCSYDVALGNDFMSMLPVTHIDPLKPPKEEDYRFFQAFSEDNDSQCWYENTVFLEPGEKLLGTTYEEVFIGKKMSARLEGKSSLGRLGLLVHLTAGFIDPGFRGRITLELYNTAKYRIALTPGMLIGQLVFTELSNAVDKGYALTGRYNNQVSPAFSRGVKKVNI